MPPLCEVGTEVGKLSTELLKPLRIPAGMSGTPGLVRDLLLECREPALVVKDPCGILEFHLEVVFLFTISAPVIKEVVLDFTRLLDGLGQILQPFYSLNIPTAIS